LNPDLSTFAYKSSLDGSARINRQNRHAGRGAGPKANRREKPKESDTINTVGIGFSQPDQMITGHMTFESLFVGLPFASAFSEPTSLFSNSLLQNFNFGSYLAPGGGLASAGVVEKSVHPKPIPELHVCTFLVSK
jgi:hypothetical protein